MGPSREHSVERRLAAILAADVAGYSRLMGMDEEGTHALLKDHRRAHLDPKITEHHGRIVKTTGDGALVEFGSVMDAVRCALEIQQGMAERNADKSPDRRIEFRIGINVGDIIIDGDDIFGDGVNIAARLEALSERGGICISAKVFDEIKGKLDISAVDIGQQRLKNIANSVRVYRVKAVNRIHNGHKNLARTRRPSWHEAADRLRKFLPREWSWHRPAILSIVSIIISLSIVTFWVLSQHTGGGTNAVNDATKPAIAVLPFANQGGDSSREYFTDGLTQDIIGALGRFPSLTVMSWNAVAPFKGKSASPEQVKESLSVRYQVEGRIRQSGDRLRVVVQLVGADGRILWSTRFDGALSDLFIFQDKITNEIAGALAIRVTEMEQRRVRFKPTENLEAYDYVLRARPALRRPSRAGIVDARRLLKRAIELDSNYAAAYSALADTYHIDVSWGWSQSPVESLRRSRELASKALSIDASEHRAHILLGRIHLFYNQYDQAKAEMELAVSINRSDPDGLAGLGNCLMWMGQTDAAIVKLELALRVDPILNAVDRFSLAMSYYLKNRYADAVHQAELNLQNSESSSFTRIVLAAAYAQLGRSEDATRAAHAAIVADPTFDPHTFGTKFRNPRDLEHLRDGFRKAGLYKTPPSKP
jgi:adenylate cyclase